MYIIIGDSIKTYLDTLKNIKSSIFELFALYNIKIF